MGKTDSLRSYLNINGRFGKTKTSMKEQTFSCCECQGRRRWCHRHSVQLTQDLRKPAIRISAFSSPKKSQQPQFPINSWTTKMSGCVRVVGIRFFKFLLDFKTEVVLVKRGFSSKMLQCYMWCSTMTAEIEHKSLENKIICNKQSL
jgi:hypothetical protein